MQNLGDLSMVVRFELDAFQPPAQSAGGEEEPTKALGALNVIQKPPSPKSAGLTIWRGGSLVPQSSLVEINSGKIKWPEVYPQLYLSGTPWLYKAAHNDGQFHTITKVGPTSPEMIQTAEKSKSRFERLRDALKIIKDIVLEAGPEGRLSFVIEDKELKVFDRESQNSLLRRDDMALFE